MILGGVRDEKVGVMIREVIEGSWPELIDDKCVRLFVNLCVESADRTRKAATPTPHLTV